MDTKAGMLVVAGICILVLTIGFLRKNAEILLNFIVRAVLGTMGIYAVNPLPCKAGDRRCGWHQSIYGFDSRKPWYRGLRASLWYYVLSFIVTNSQK